MPQTQWRAKPVGMAISGLFALVRCVSLLMKNMRFDISLLVSASIPSAVVTKQEGDLKMALPQMTDEQRAKALKKAKETRRKRAEVREKIKLGKLTAKKVLAKRSDPIYGKIKVSQFIESFPGYGKAKAEKLMTEIGIAEGRRLSGLGEKQVAALIEALD